MPYKFVVKLVGTSEGAEKGHATQGHETGGGSLTSGAQKLWKEKWNDLNTAVKNLPDSDDPQKILRKRELESRLEKVSKKLLG